MALRIPCARRPSAALERLRGRLVLLLVALQLASGALAPGRSDGGEEPAGDPSGPPLVPLAELRADPPAHLGERVRFVLQFHAELPRWNPYLTRFGRGEWRAFSAWPDERFTWDEAVFRNPAERLFVGRESALALLLPELETYERFEAVAVVHEVFLDEPWLEVESLRPLPELVGKGTILHVERARRFEEKGQWRLALDQLDRAAAGPLPDHARRELDRLRAALLRAEELEARERARTPQETEGLGSAFSGP